MEKIEQFLEENHSPGSYLAVLQIFMRKKIEHGLAVASLFHLYRSLYALGKSLNNPQLKTITRRHIRTYAIRLSQHYSPGTLRTVFGDLKQFFKWAKKKGHHSKNVGKRLKKPRPISTGTKAPPEAAVDAVFDYLVAHLRPLVYRDEFGSLRATEGGEWKYEDLKHLHDLFALAFLYETGCRAGELANLATRNMNRVTEDLKPAYTVFSWGKTESQRLRFTNYTAEIWRLWYEIRPYNHRLAIYSWRRGCKPSQATTNGISQMLVRRCKQGGITLFRAHSLRHLKGRRSRQLLDLGVTSKLMGHSNLSVTQKYDNIEEEELLEATIKTGIQRDFWQPHRPCGC